MLSVFQYENYRDFLKDYYEFKKQHHNGFSYRVFSKKLGFTSPNFIKLVISGNRNLSLKSAKKISRAFQFDESESHYFHSLLLLSRAKNEKERSLIRKKLNETKMQAHKKILDEKYQKYLSHWYYITIREMTLLKSFQEDGAWIADQLNHKVSATKALTAIDDMLTLGLLKKDPNGRLMVSNKILSTADEAIDVSIKKTHKDLINKAMNSLDHTTPAFRDISSLTIALNQEGFDELKNSLQEFRKKLNLRLSQCQSPDAVYQINFQAFNLTKSNWIQQGNPK